MRGVEVEAAGGGTGTARVALASPTQAGMRLVHVTTVPETLLFLSGQAGYLRGRGFEVSAIASPGAELDLFAEREGIACFGVPMERRIAPWRDAVALARLARTLRRLRPDIVDAHTPKAGLLGMMAAWAVGVPVRVYHLHGLRFTTARGARRQLLRITERVAALLATRVVSVSPSIADAAVRERLVRRDKVGVLLAGSINGVDATGRFRAPGSAAERQAARAALGIRPDARVLGFVGRIAREKGVGELIEAWRELRRDLPDLHLLLVGPEEPHDPVPREAWDALRGDPRVSCVGLARDTPRHYRAMDVVALPSYREGFPVVPLEAAAMGLPVVATRVEGCVDAVVDGVTGTLVPPRDPGALADALRRYLEDPALRERHGAAARARVLRDYDPARLWGALHDEYVRLAAAGRRRGGGARAR